MSSITTAQGAAFATAMAVSGTVILLALRLQKSLPPTQFSSLPSQPPILRSCISSGGKKTKKKKRVRFAEDVMDRCGDGEEYRKRHLLKMNSRSKVSRNCNGGNGMPANRVALYNGILRDRVNQRLAYC
ncbi:unnamed protein product [Vicia faba]|uniref:Uncharacterized protein n=1 Tax=Vicia faba TaxID=3906 RepID=A0AAV1AJ19_VICFA|nr:unnamed protein product [Vicia faba]